MKNISVPTKSPAKKEVAEQRTEKQPDQKIEQEQVEPKPRKRNIRGEKRRAASPKSFRFSSLDEERFELFRSKLADEVGEENLSDAKVLKALLLLSQQAPKSMIKKITDAMM